MTLSAGPARAAGDDVHAILGPIERVEMILAQETRSLGALSIAAHKDLNRRKSLSLLELTRAARALGGQPVGPALAERLGGLRHALLRNQAVLQTHLDAVREIAQIIATTLQERESDGTYTDAVPVRSRIP